MDSKMVTCYRGLFCREGQSVEKLLRANEKKCKENENVQIEVRYPQHNLSVEEVVELVKSSKERLGPENNATFVTTDITYAETYATDYSSDKNIREGAVLKCRLDKDLLRVDGRDFLYSFHLFELSDCNLAILAKAYGDKIIEYGRALEQFVGGDLSKVFTFIDYITLDTTIIDAHLKSDTVIAGRYCRYFKNSFVYNGPILENDIVEIKKYEGILHQISHNSSLDDIIMGNLRRRTSY